MVLSRACERAAEMRARSRRVGGSGLTKPNTICLPAERPGAAEPACAQAPRRICRLAKAALEHHPESRSPYVRRLCKQGARRFRRASFLEREAARDLRFARGVATAKASVEGGRRAARWRPPPVGPANNLGEWRSRASDSDPRMGLLAGIDLRAAHQALPSMPNHREYDSVNTG